MSITSVFSVKGMSELLTPYVLCQIVGAILLIGAALAQQYEKNKSSEKQREALANATEKLQDGLAKRDVALAELVFARSEIDKITERLKTLQVGAKPEKNTIAQSIDLDLAKVDERISRVLSEIPKEIQESYKKEKMAEFEEGAARSRAEAVNLEFRPRILSAISTLKSAVVRSSDKGVIALEKIEEGEAVPNKLMFTAYEFAQARILDEDPSKATVIKFSNGKNWRVYTKFGFVKSPESKARWFGVPTDIFYPMIRIQIGDENIGTVYFNQESKLIRLEYDGDRAVREKLVSLQEAGSDADVVAAFVVELVKLSRRNGQ